MLVLGDAGPDWRRVAAALIPLSAAALAALWMLLRPLARISNSLLDLVPEASGDEYRVLNAGIEELRARAGALQHRLAGRHPVSGLPTREALALAIAEDLSDMRGPSLLGAIRFADFNRLAIFDPAVADAALKCFSDRLSTSLGPGRPMAQVDRDCFAIWFRDSDAAMAEMELQALCYALGADLAAGDMRLVPEIEVGRALYPGDAGTPAALINHAAAMLARHVPAGAGQLAPAPSSSVARERFALEQDLHRAIEREQLFMVYQPVVDLARGKLVGAEALLRWRHPRDGLVSPARFVPILEDADLIDEIGRWTLNAACKEVGRWQRRGLEGLKVAVNLSANQLRDPGLKSMIQRTLALHRLQPQILELELTETAAAADAERTFALFAELRALGVSLAIDDFGSGYSSLSYLKKLPFDKLKIDREFVVDVHKRSDSQAICRSLIELTRGLGIQLLAEGVEQGEEVETLRRLGCRIFQGFYFSEPLDGERFATCARDPAWRLRLQNPVARAQAGLETRISA